MTALVKYEAARAALAAAHRVDEVKSIRDKAQAMAAYAKQARDTELITKATEIKVRAERRCGELLQQVPRHERARTDTVPHGDAQTPLQQARADAGISRAQADRYQRLAAMPAEHFETAVETAKATAGEVTSAHMLRLAAELRAAREVEEMLAAARATRDQKSIDADEWQPIRGALLSLHRHVETARSLPECPSHLKEELLPKWRTVSRFLAATFKKGQR